MKTYNPQGLRRFPCDGIANFRDLGGLPCKGGMTRYGVFYRSTKLSSASEQDIALIASLGIGKVLDFRFPQETEEEPDRLPPNCLYENYSLMGSIPVEKLKVRHVPMTKTLYPMYKQILEYGKQEVKGALESAMKAEYPLLYHCVAGKDRTGLVSMFLYSLVGVDRMDIIADYEISHTLVQTFTTDITGSHYHNMERILAFLDKKYGSVEGYVSSLGIPEATILSLQDKFVEEGKKNIIND